MSISSEMDTVVKRVLPYLRRRGYEDEVDLDFETPMKLATRYANGYADILVTCGKATPRFLIEAKRDARKLTNKDRDQAIEYGVTLKTSFVVVTNGTEVRCYNTRTKAPILWNGKLIDKIPSKAQLPKVLAFLKANPSGSNIELDDTASPFRPSLPLKQLNALFKRCHSAIRKIEKDEDNAFADFSKLLFLKLLEEKEDVGLFVLPYSYHFSDLADRPSNEADQVMAAILDMVEKVRKDGYGDVLQHSLKLKNPKTFHYIVKQLSGVYFADSNLDSKGAAFEYFVRATLKGKKLGQYFTPRPLIDVMVRLCGEDKVLNAVRSGDSIKVLDPSCGTGGFLVYVLNLSLAKVQDLLLSNQITTSTSNKLIKELKGSTFFGSDANAGVACSAKMNMIVAGDGHTNIEAENSLARSSKNWKTTAPDVDLILTNPPFGTSESDSLTADDLKVFPVPSSKGQNLFLQKMILATKPGGEICTVIDEGMLNNEAELPLRKWILQHCQLLAILRLPEETFKPNKINVRASVLYLKRRESTDEDLESKYEVTFCDITSLGYLGSGEPIRSFDRARFLSEFSDRVRNQSLGIEREGYKWRAFDLNVRELVTETTHRFDLKYWDPAVRNQIKKLKENGSVSVKDINLITTSRGNSPKAELYVDEIDDGYAIVLKAGSSITKYGHVLVSGDFIQENVYEAMGAVAKVVSGDVLLASTGVGTLGKCGLYTATKPAVADGHVTIIRPDTTKIDPNYLTDYLRAGFGAVQVQRLFSGATGLIELTCDQVNSIEIDLLGGDLEKQKAESVKLRKAEASYRDELSKAQADLKVAQGKFAKGFQP